MVCINVGVHGAVQGLTRPEQRRLFSLTRNSTYPLGPTASTLTGVAVPSLAEDPRIASPTTGHHGPLSNLVPIGFRDSVVHLLHTGGAWAASVPYEPVNAYELITQIRQNYAVLLHSRPGIIDSQGFPFHDTKCVLEILARFFSGWKPKLRAPTS